MLRKNITEQYSVSEQITLEDVETLASSGVDLIICNRPDGEEDGQLSFAEVEQKASELGVKAVHIPFAGGQMKDTDVLAFDEVIKDAKQIHAYCRTGNRSTKIWEASHAANSDMLNAANADAELFDVVVVGAGSAGIAMAASLLKRKSSLRIVLVDPATNHYYQPGWTMVGGGVFKAPQTSRTMAEVIPSGVKWIKEAVTSFYPESNKVLLENGKFLAYQQLVVAAGLKLNWEAIEGLPETLGKNGVTSNYRYDLAPYTWQLVQELKGGKAVFTQPPMPIKCAGAPQKAMYLSCDHWFKNGALKDIEVSFYNAGGVLFGVKEYVPALESYVKKYNAQLKLNNRLVKVDGPNKMAYFVTANEAGEEVVVETKFDMLHVCPPQCAPDFIRTSPLADAAGWVDVDQHSLQHKTYPNVWGLGDVTNTPNAKTMAAARKQAPVVAQNIFDVFEGRKARAVYDGYGSCPLTVERGKIVLAEFGYGGKLLPTFPKWFNDGTTPTWFAWFLKEDLLPPFYWHGMLKGREWFVKPEMKG